MRFLHQAPSTLVVAGLSTSVIREGVACCAGLSRKAAAWFQTVALLLVGVDGVRICAVSVGAWTFLVREAVPLLSNKDACGWGSSGSTSSRRRSAAFCACSALARNASSTMGWGTLGG